MKFKVNGRVLTVREEYDLAKYPNQAKFLQRSFSVQGPRGAWYLLDQRKDGSWFCMSRQGARVERNPLVEAV